MDKIINSLQELEKNYLEEIQILREKNKDLNARIDSYEMGYDSVNMLRLQLDSYEATLEELRTEIKRLNIDLEHQKSLNKTKKNRPVM